MSILFDEGSSSLGLGSADPMLAGINGATDELRLASAVEVGAEGPEDEVLKAAGAEDGIDELLVPQNGPGALKVGKSGAEILEESSGGKSPPGEKDALTGEGDEVVVGEVDGLTGGSSESVEIETRARKRDLAGNNRRKAYNIGTLDGTKSYSDFVGRGDRKDFYKFTIDGEGAEVEIGLSGLSGNADLYLQNSRGKTIKKSKKGGRRSEAISETLEPGDYYVQVRSRNKRVNANYTLSLEAEATSSELEYAPDEILVKLKSEPTVALAQSVVASSGAVAIENLVQPDPNINSEVERWQLLKFEPGTDIEAMQKRLQKDPKVESVELNYKVSIDSVPNDPDFDELWGLNNTGSNGGKSDADIDAPEAWDIQKGSKDVIVAVIDTGVDYNHPDLRDNIWKNAGEIPGNKEDDDNNGYVDDIYGYDWFNDDGDPMDEHSHGTHVAGTIGAVGDNNRGVVGVNHNVSIMPLQYFSKNGEGSTSGDVGAIVYAANMGADIINASYGGGPASEAVEDAIRYANEKGVLFVAAAGNDGNNNDAIPHYPSNYNLPNVISVAATNNKDELAFFGTSSGKDYSSNFGSNTVDLGAPGHNIFSTIPKSKYAPKSGTSMAAPHVAGAAALLLAENPDLSVTELKNALLDNTDAIASLQGKTVTGGRLNVNKAIQAVSQPKEPDDFITVVSPNGGNTLETGKSYNITWDDNFSGNVSIYLFKDDEFDRMITNSTASDGSYTWTVPTDLATGSDYQVAIQSVNNTDIFDFSNSNFTIDTPEPEEYITVTSPNGGNTLEIAQSYNITWNDNISDSVRIYLYKDSELDRIITNSTSSDGSYIWTVPASLVTGSDYQIAIQSLGDNNIYDFSNSNFTIDSKEEDYITVISPNGGNTLEIGQKYTITWNDNIDENVKINLFMYQNGNTWGGNIGTIAESTPSDGSYTWEFVNNFGIFEQSYYEFDPNSRYKVLISSVDDRGIYDYSNSEFDIS